MQLVEINDAAKKLLACDQSLLGMTPAEISQKCPPLNVMQEMIEERCEGEIFRMEAKDCDGESLAFGLTMAPLTGQGERELGTVLVLRDESLPARQVEM